MDTVLKAFSFLWALVFNLSLVLLFQWWFEISFDRAAILFLLIWVILSDGRSITKSIKEEEGKDWAILSDARSVSKSIKEEEGKELDNGRT